MCLTENVFVFEASERSVFHIQKPFKRTDNKDFRNGCKINKLTEELEGIITHKKKIIAHMLI